MVVKHCSCGLCTNDNRYPEKLPPGTVFLSLARPSKIKPNIDEWKITNESRKTVKVKWWIQAYGP